MTLALLTTAGAAHQVRSAKRFGDPQLRGIELDALYFPDDVENRIRLRASANRMCLAGITGNWGADRGGQGGTAEMRTALSPRNTEAIEDVGLSTAYYLSDLGGRDIAIVSADTGHAMAAGFAALAVFRRNL